MGVRLKLAQTANELDDVFWVRQQVFAVEEKKYNSVDTASPHLVDRFDAHPKCANLIAYEDTQPIATIRLNLDTGSGLPPEQYFDFSNEKSRIEIEWLLETGEKAHIGSAGMLAVRKNWRKRRDVIRALFKLAATIGSAWEGTHIIVSANHENSLMYQRVGFSPLADKIWVEEIGNHIVPMVSTFDDFYARTIGQSFEFEKVGLFEKFSNQFQRAVFRAGELIFREFDEAEECYVIDVGSVRITTTNAKDGRELTLAAFGPGEIFGEMALIDAKTRSANAIAVTDTEVLVVHRRDFVDGLRTNPDRLEGILGFFSDRLRRTGQFAKLLAYGSAEQRLEHALRNILESAKAMRRPDGTCVLRAGPRDLAAAAGTEMHEAIDFLDALTERGYCTYSSKSIKILVCGTESAGN